MTIFATSCSDAPSGCRINRESGENPEQTRCCKPSKKGCPITTSATALLGWEGGQTGVSQKTCKTCFLNCRDSVTY
jgi:hypothetical protein